MDEYTLISETCWENGNPKRKKVRYNNGVIVVKDYYDTGTIWQFTTLNPNEEMHGIHSIFYPSGKPQIEEYYKEGKIVYQKTFNQFGQQLTLDNYQDGELFRRIILLLGIIDFLN